MPPEFGQVVVFRSGLLGSAQTLVRGLDVLVIAGPLVALALLAGAVGLAPPPTRGRLLAIGGAVLVACCLVARLAIALCVTTFVDTYSQPTGRLAAAAFADALVADLVRSMVVLLLVEGGWADVQASAASAAAIQMGNRCECGVIEDKS